MLMTNDMIFIHIPKTAGSCITHALKTQKPLMMRNIRVGADRHITLKKLTAEIGHKAVASKFTFAFVRNSWDRILSLYCHIIENGHNNSLWRNNVPHYKDIGFNRWVIEELEHAPTYWGAGAITQQSDWISPGVDFVGRFENLEKDFKIVCKKINIKYHRVEDTRRFNDLIPIVGSQRKHSRLQRRRSRTKVRRNTLPPTNMKNHKHYTDVYNDEAKAKVAELFAQDIKMFNHKFS